MIAGPPSSTLAGASVLLAVDDTDNATSRGTGRLVRSLADAIRERRLGRPLGITRHQLLVDDRIPYTSHNSSACIALECDTEPPLEALIRMAGAFLAAESAPGSDPGLAVASAARWREPEGRRRLAAYGLEAKREVLDRRAAITLAHETGVHLSAHGGDGGGVIGALAAVGLHCSGEDGRFLWMPGMRELAGEVTYRDLREAVAIDAAVDPDGREPAPGERIELGDWVRPVLRGGRAILLLEAAPADDEAAARWTASPREVVKLH